MDSAARLAAESGAFAGVSLSVTTHAVTATKTIVRETERNLNGWVIRGGLMSTFDVKIGAGTPKLADCFGANAPVLSGLRSPVTSGLASQCLSDSFAIESIEALFGH